MKPGALGVEGAHYVPSSAQTSQGDRTGRDRERLTERRVFITECKRWRIHKLGLQHRKQKLDQKTTAVCRRLCCVEKSRTEVSLLLPSMMCRILKHAPSVTWSRPLRYTSAGSQSTRFAAGGVAETGTAAPTSADMLGRPRH